MIVKKKTTRSVTEPREAPPKPTRPKIPVAMLIRMFLVGSIAVVGSSYALWRHYTVPRMPMYIRVVPTTSASSSASATPHLAASASASEIEIEVPPP